MSVELDEAEYRQRVETLVNHAIGSRDSINTLVTGLRLLKARRNTCQVVPKQKDGLIELLGYNPWEAEAC